MDRTADSDARCIAAIMLTVRFALTNFLTLGALLFICCMAFGRGSSPAGHIAMWTAVIYFTFAYRNVGRGTRTSSIIMSLAGLSAGTITSTATTNVVAAENWSTEEDDSSLQINLAGIDLNSGGVFSDDTSMFYDNSYSINPASGLPMVNDAVDIHGNIFGTNSVDDHMGFNSSAFDDSMTYSSFDNGMSTTTFDDDWNK